MATVTAGYNWVSGEIVTPAKLNSTGSPTVVLADGEVTNAKLASGIDAAKVTTGTLPITRIADGAVVAAKMQNGVSLQTVVSSKSSVQSLANVVPYDNTVPQSGEGEEILTASITPSSATNKVLVEATITGTQANAGTIIFALFRGSSANAIGTAIHSFQSGYGGQCHVAFYDSPATTSATTYRLRGGYASGGSGFYINGSGTGGALFGGTLISWMKLTEIKAS
jgi:hypothetical protein